mmetsp:Transcript_30940/g.65258  ORF Transcript_30940/g.65258 Transcript_30940/m.65258 type:complete len:130 (+) Transcript_30940:1230-1619(+)
MAGGGAVFGPGLVVAHVDDVGGVRRAMGRDGDLAAGNPSIIIIIRRRFQSARRRRRNRRDRQIDRASADRGTARAIGKARLAEVALRALAGGAGLAAFRAGVGPVDAAVVEPREELPRPVLVDVGVAEF